MEPITCLYCGEMVSVSSFDVPVRFREDPADDVRPRQFVMYGDNYWLMHRCEIAEGEPPRFEA